MMQASVNVKYVNPPKGKGPASIKDDQGNYWKFWTDKIPLDRFQTGHTYSVGYETEDYQGKEQRTITAVSMPQEQAPKIGNGAAKPEMGRQTAPVDAERMFVCSLVNAGIRAGQIQFTTTDIAEAVNCARSAWQGTFGKQ